MSKMEIYQHSVADLELQLLKENNFLNAGN